MRSAPEPSGAAGVIISSWWVRDHVAGSPFTVIALTREPHQVEAETAQALRGRGRDRRDPAEVVRPGPVPDREVVVLHVVPAVAEPRVVRSPILSVPADGIGTARRDGQALRRPPARSPASSASSTDRRRAAHAGFRSFVEGDVTQRMLAGSSESASGRRRLLGYGGRITRRGSAVVRSRSRREYGCRARGRSRARRAASPGARRWRGRAAARRGSRPR